MMFFTTCSACGMRAAQPSPEEVGDQYDGLCFKCQADVTWHRQQGSRYGAAGCHCDSCWVSHLEAAEMGAVYHRGSRARYRRAVEARVDEWEGEAEFMLERVARMRESLMGAWTEAQFRAVERRAKVHTDAARRARAILERLEAKR